MEFVKADPDPLLTGLDELAGRTNYFIGDDPNRWATDVPRFGRVAVEELWAGVDLMFYTTPEGNVRHDFLVQPGAEPENIRLRYGGALPVLDDGGLRLDVDGRPALRVDRPYTFQTIEGRTVEVPSTLALDENGDVRVSLGEYDASHALVIDPAVVGYSTFLGGDGAECTRFCGSGLDAAGNLYVAGDTQSNDFPTENAFQPAYADNQDVFVAKFAADGRTFVYGTYLGGAGTDFPRALAVAPDGTVYLTGATNSLDFPLSNAYQDTPQGNSDAFVLKLAPSGAGLDFSTFLGGTDADEGLGIAVDASGSAYVVGDTRSPDFPTRNALQAQAPGAGTWEAFVTKFAPDGNVTDYSTYLGGTGTDFGRGVAVDSGGSAYVTGFTNSVDFPTRNAFQPVKAFNYDAFVTKLSASGDQLSYSTFLGGNGTAPVSGRGTDRGIAIAVDAVGNAYVAGETLSDDFPTSSAYQPEHGGDWDAFVAKIAPGGAALAFSTYFGGSSLDQGKGLVVDSRGYAFLTGYTHSTNLPTAGPQQPTLRGGSDAFLAVVGPTGDSLPYASYLGGSGDDFGGSLALDAAGNVYVSGGTFSTDFPVGAAYQATNAGGSDAFVTKLRLLGSETAVVSNLLPARGFSSAVWTGSRAYVIGGQSAAGQSRLDLITVYDPASNQVNSVGALPPPNGARCCASAIWDGAQVYVFGGDAGDSFVGDIVRFDPSTGETRRMNATLQPPRSHTSAVWDGSYAYVFGGDSTEGKLADIVRYDPVADEAVTIPFRLPTVRYGTSAVWDGEDAYLFGGVGTANFLTEIVRFNPDTGATTLGVMLPSRRIYTSAAFDGSLAYVFGGLAGFGGGDGAPVDDILAFDTSSETKPQPVAKLPASRYATSAVWTGANASIFGGWAGEYLSEIVRYGPVFEPGAPFRVASTPDWTTTPAGFPATNAYGWATVGAGLDAYRTDLDGSITTVIDMGPFANKDQLFQKDGGYELDLHFALNGTFFVDRDGSYDPYTPSMPWGDEPCHTEPFDLFTVYVNEERIRTVQANESGCVGEGGRVLNVIPGQDGDPPNRVRVPTYLVQAGSNTLRLEIHDTPYTHPQADKAGDGWRLILGSARMQLVAPPVFIAHGLSIAFPPAGHDVAVKQWQHDLATYFRNQAVELFGQDPWSWAPHGDPLAIPAPAGLPWDCPVSLCRTQPREAKLVYDHGFALFAFDAKQDLRITAWQLREAVYRTAGPDLLGYCFACGDGDEGAWFIGHSGGGVVERYLLQRTGSQALVGNYRLITMGTPHLGIGIADAMQRVLSFSDHQVRNICYYANIEGELLDLATIRATWYDDTVQARAYEVFGAEVFGATGSPCDYPLLDHRVEFEMQPMSRNPFLQDLDLDPGLAVSRVLAVAGNRGLMDDTGTDEYWDGFVTITSATSGGRYPFVVCAAHHDAAGEKWTDWYGTVEGCRRPMFDFLTSVLPPNGGTTVAPTAQPTSQAMMQAESEPEETFRDLPSRLAHVEGNPAIGPTRWEAIIPIDPTETALLTTFWLDGTGNLTFTLIDPAGNEISPVTAGQFNATYGAGPGFGLAFATYSLSNPLPGAWTARVEASETTPESGSDALVLAQVQSSTSLTADSPVRVDPGEPALLTARLDPPVPGASVEAFVEPSNVTLLLYDDGLGADAVADDGTYSANYLDTHAPGTYSVDVVARGPPDGPAWERAARTGFLSQTALDVRLRDVTLDAPVLWRGDTAHVSVVVENAGSAEAAGVLLSWSDDSETLLGLATTGSATLAPLSPGESQVVVIDWTPTPGTRRLTMQVVASGLEETPTDNQASASVEALSASITTAMLEGLDGEGGWFRSNVTFTLGPAQAGGANATTYYTLDGGASTPYTGPVSVSSDGTHVLAFRSVDEAGHVEPTRQVPILIDATPPDVSGLTTPPANANGWNHEDVTVTWNCTDATSGVQSSPNSSVVADEAAGQSRSVSCTDQAGNVATAGIGGINIDKTAPTVAGTRTPEANARGWNNENVTVSFGCADHLSGVDHITKDTVMAEEGAGQFVTGACTDLAGNAAEIAFGPINIDLTAPNGTVTAPVASAGAFLIHWKAADALSGLDVAQIQEQRFLGFFGEPFVSACSFNLGGSSSSTGDCARDPPPGQYCYRVRVFDSAGNEFVSSTGDPSDPGNLIAQLLTTCTAKT